MKKEFFGKTKAGDASVYTLENANHMSVLMKRLIMKNPHHFLVQPSEEMLTVSAKANLKSMVRHIS